MADFNKTYLFRITHIENIAHILQNGITRVTSVKANPNFVSIDDGSLIDTRNDFVLNNGRKLGAYIPFYFGFKTPMLYVVQRGFNMVTPTSAENIVYCVSSVQKILEQQLDFIFTDGHAINQLSKQYSMSDIQNIDTILDMSAISAKYWKDDNDLDKKRRKEADFLILDDIPITAVLGFVVFNEAVKTKIVALGVEASVVRVDSNYYF